MNRYEHVFALDNAGPSKVQGPEDEHDKSTQGMVLDHSKISSCTVASKENVPMRDRVSDRQ
jgi:hypothetical protein